MLSSSDVTRVLTGGAAHVSLSGSFICFLRFLHHDDELCARVGILHVHAPEGLVLMQRAARSRRPG